MKLAKAARATQTVDGLSVAPSLREGFLRRLGIFAAWRLQAYGYALAAVYAVLLAFMYKAGIWPVGAQGVPVYTDFMNFWFAGAQALHGETKALYDPETFTKIQQALVGAGHYVYSIWPYPPTFFLVLAPLALLPYLAAFLIWDMVTLLGCAAVVYRIVGHPAAIALLLASPFTVWNLNGGQDGFLMASLLGGALLLLERRPVLAGMLIGCLTFKPQFGILLPIALAASNRWRTFASATVTAAVLAGASLAAFGLAAWIEFPRELLAQASEALVDNPIINPFPVGWGHQQTVYGLVRALHGGPALAWLLQGATTIGLMIAVWFVWRSRMRYSLKAAALSAATLVATPYAYAYDMAAIAIPLAFVAKDQIRYGLLRGEQTTMVVLFAASLVILGTFGYSALGPLVLLALVALVLRRDLSWWEMGRQPRKFCEIF